MPLQLGILLPAKGALPIPSLVGRRSLTLGRLLRKALESFDYYWRVEPGVEFKCDIDYDPFIFVRGYRVLGIVHEAEFGALADGGQQQGLRLHDR